MATDPDFENAGLCECPTASSIALSCPMFACSSQCHWQNASDASNSDQWSREAFKWLLSILMNFNYFLLDFPVSTMSHIFRGISNSHRNAVQGWIGPQLIS